MTSAAFIADSEAVVRVLHALTEKPTMPKSSLWVLLLDTSGSMGEPFRGRSSFDGIYERTEASIKLDAAKDVLLRQVKGLSHSDIALVSFTESAQTLFQGSASSSELVNAIGRLSPGGGTDISHAIRHAALGFSPSRSYSVVTFLLITDGLSEPTPAIEAAESAFSSGIRISSILIDPTPEGEQLLRAISLGGDVKGVGTLHELDQAVMQAERSTAVMAPAHQEAALLLHVVIVAIFGILALACIGGGIYSVYRNAQSPTEFSLLGSKLSTGHVGVAFVGIGLLVGLFTVRSVLRSQHILAALPPAPRARHRKRRTK